MKYETVLQKMCTIKYTPEADSYNIILCLDKNLFNPMLVLIYACAKNFLKKINLFILQSDFSEEDKDIVKEFCESLEVNLCIIEMNDNDFSGFGKHRYPNQIFYYLKTHTVIPFWLERACYFDIDTLPLKDISPFYNVDFESSWIVASNEYDTPFFNTYFRDKINMDFKYRPLYSSANVYNSGILLLNLDKFRKNKVTLDNFIRLMEKGDFITGLGDQTLINKFTGTDIKLFPKPYFNCWVGHTISSLACFEHPEKSNEVYSYFNLDMELINSIIHFAGFPSIKPWNALKGINNGKFEFVKGATGKYDTPQANKEIEKYVRIWWEYAQHIPAKNYGELVASSIALNADKHLQAERKYNFLKQVTPGYANIAPLGKARQSSISQWSQGVDEANCALTGKLKAGEDHAFHTNFEPLAWWMVDLQDYYKLRMVKLINRDSYRERYTAEKLQILFSQDGVNWVDFGHPVVSPNGDAYILELPGLLFKFVKVQVRNQALHFKQICIYI